MFRRKDDGLADANLLDLRPVRTADWSTGEDEEQRITVERGVPPGRGIRSWFRRLSFMTGVKRLRLDGLGTAVWQRLDGVRTVSEVVTELRDTFGDGCEPAEERLAMFLGLLRREELIGYPGWDDERIAVWQQAQLEAESESST